MFKGIGAMKSAALLAACATIFLAAGCKTTGTERAAKAAESLEALQADIQTAADRLGASVTALNDLVKSPKEDPKPQFVAFTTAMDALEAQLGVVRNRKEAMKARGQEYFKNWEESSKTLSSPEMKQYSEERRGQLGKIYDDIKAEIDRANELGKPLMTSLRDTRTFLAMDLTASGLALAAKPAEKANTDAEALKVEVEKLRNSLDEVARLLAPPAPKK